MKLRAVILPLMFFILMTPGVLAQTVTVTDPENDLVIPANSNPAPKPLYADFIDMTEASATLEDGIYTFRITVKGDALPANPMFTSLPNKPIHEVRYAWSFIGSSGNYLGDIWVWWHDGDVGAMSCNMPLGCAMLLDTLSWGGHSLWVTVPEDAFNEFYGGTLGQWWARSEVKLTPYWGKGTGIIDDTGFGAAP